LLDDYSKIFLLPKHYQKWYTKDTVLSLIPVGTVEQITTQNLYYSLENETLLLGYKTGSSNHVIEDGIVDVKHQKGDLLLMECWD
jgi:thiamine pyrophosphokinase